MAIIKDFLGVDIDSDKVKKPSELYRLMHPEYFSDSKEEPVQFTREQFKNTMARLSEDMRQDAFEELTRRCVVRLITPNIIPQTGPTGGGDAKADLLTYPVSEDVASTWYMSDETMKAGKELWAFAISCKQQWSAKMDSDVKKIKETYPDCKRIYFCTNQPVSARKKMQKQDKYRKDEWKNVETQILDLNWYIQAVYDQGCYDDAIEVLGLGDSLKQEKVTGPRDAERLRRLAEIEKCFPQHTPKGIDDKYVAALLEAAKMTRGLGRSEAEVQGRYLIALETAKKHGLPQQVFECIYQIAWTSFNWYDDADEALRRYRELRTLLGDDVNVSRIEKLYNIYRLLVTATGLGLLKEGFNQAEEREFFKSEYNELSEKPAKPSSALFLKISLLEDDLMSLLTESGSKGNDNLDDLLDALKADLAEATHHLDISFESHAEVLVNLGRMIGYNEKFEELIDIISDIQSNRNKDVSAADVHYSRGVSLMERDAYEEAIRHLSKSYVLYHKENTKEQLIRTSGILGFAYKEQDLLYSAKTCFGKSLGMLMKSMGDDGRSSHLAISIIRELCVIELRLGQLTSFLEWLRLMDGIVTMIPNYLNEEFITDRSMLDALLGSRLFDTQLNDDGFGILPDILQRHQLNFSRNVLLLKMGKSAELDEEYRFLTDSEDNTRMYIQQMAQGIKYLYPIVLNTKNGAKLQTLVHGCNIKAEFNGYTYCQTYSEMFLGFMELLLGDRKGLFPSSAEIVFEIKCDTEGETKIDSGEHGNIFKVHINKNTFESQHNIWETLIQMMSTVLSQSVMVNNLEEFLKERQESTLFMTRLSVLSGYVVDLDNFFPRERMSYIEMFSRKDDKKYTFKKDNANDSKRAVSKQEDTHVTSLIDIKLWNEAKWHGCGYLLARDYSEPGIMVLLYDNIASGIKIFEQWEKDYNAGELNIKIALIKGVDKRHPQWYKVLIHPDVAAIHNQKDNKARYIVSAARFHLMTAQSDINVRELQKLYQKFRFIGLSAAAMENNQMSWNPNKRYNKVLPIRNIEFVDAWRIGANDPMSAAILAEDDVIIPQERAKDAPVLEVLAKKRNYGTEDI